MNPVHKEIRLVAKRMDNYLSDRMSDTRNLAKLIKPTFLLKRFLFHCYCYCFYYIFVNILLLSTVSVCIIYVRYD
jgi:hypothetical protein